MISRLTKLRGEREEGFTLIELLVVIIIIGILAAIAIPVFLNQRARAQDSATVSAVKSYTTAVESFLVTSPTAASVTTADAEREGARKSAGVEVRISGGAGSGGYTICGFNTSGKQYAAQGTALVFSSAAGTSSVAACPTTGAAGVSTSAAGSTPAT